MSAPRARLYGRLFQVAAVEEQEGSRGALVCGSAGVVVVAASLGGLRAFETILRGLPPDFPLPIVFVQHLSDRYPTYLADLLTTATPLRVRWLRDRDSLESGVVHVAPPGLHTIIDGDGRAASWHAPRINHVRPAADVLLTSAAATFGASTTAVVLTGRLFDGAAGALSVRRAGGVVIAQDPATCRAAGMPRATIEAGAAHFVLAPNGIASALVALTMTHGTRALFGWARVA